MEVGEKIKGIVFWLLTFAAFEVVTCGVYGFPDAPHAQLLNGAVYFQPQTLYL